ncbi:hypothetical protein Dimus_007549 [Dionaea muscipula]
MDLTSSPSSSSSPYKKLIHPAAANRHHQQGGGGGSIWLHPLREAAPAADTRNNYYHHHHQKHHRMVDASPETTADANTISSNNQLDDDEAEAATTTRDSSETDQAAGAVGVGGGAAAESSSGGAYVEREHMFDKVVTPSDVGKLNRLVIPKQHAERYFPLDPSADEKGLLLNFEDRCGKAWRFRYSYWNSSQSYVMTKGWSRFVKEKKLDAGDIISFQRGVGDLGKESRFYIDWRRRLPPDSPLPPSGRLLTSPHQVPPAMLLPPVCLNFNFTSPLYHQYQPSSPAWTSNVSTHPVILRPHPPPPHLVPLPGVMRDYRSQQHASQLPQTNVISMIPQFPGHQQQGLNIISLNSTTASPGAYQYYQEHRHRHQRQNYHGRHCHGDNIEHCDDREATVLLRPPRGASSSSSSVVYGLNTSTGPQLQVQAGGGGGGGVGGTEPTLYESVPVVQQRSAAAAAAPKQLRLFGVNMEYCPISQAHDDDDDDGDVILAFAPTRSTAGVNAIAVASLQPHDHHHHHHHHPHQYVRRDHDHDLRVSASDHVRDYIDGAPTQPHHQDKGKSSSLSLDLGI